MIRFREMSAYVAVKEVFRHKRSWSFLLDFIDCSDEVDETDTGDIQFVYWNGVSLDKNYFTNDSNFFWIAGYDDKNRLCFLQLMHKWSKKHLELVVAQKKYTSNAENLFGQLIEHIRKEYPTTTWLSTFPMNDRLKDYYMLNGFKEWKKELKLELK